jgi:signal transduction histidine kinase
MQLPMAMMAFPLSILGSRYLKFREAIIDIQNENTTLENLALRLSRLNSQYQSAAISATEKGQTQERMRITRDIHDIVGYTLTNNIMLMETARDMMLENPLGIPALIESARENAEDGLTRIRAALYDLRGQENYVPDGLLAIHKLIRVFSEATGVEVGIDILMPSITLPEAADSTLYHLVQESMINSLRHGKATRIAVMLWLEGGMLAVTIRDNGIGAQKVAEGIGLSGMHERIENLGGSFSASGGTGEFVVKARIPLALPTIDQPKEYIHGA